MIKKILQQFLILALVLVPLVSFATIFGATVNPATNIGNDKATLVGNINFSKPENKSLAVLGFFYLFNTPIADCSATGSLFTSQPNFTTIGANEATTSIGFERLVTGLLPGTNYWYCMIAFDQPEGEFQSAPTKSNIITIKTLPKITSFTASPSNIVSGGKTTLTWQVEGAASCSSSTSLWAGPKNEKAGSEEVKSIQNTTTFTLTCSNGLSIGNVTASTTVTVSPLGVVDNISGVTTGEATQVTDKSAKLSGTGSSSAGTSYGYFRLSKVAIPPIFCNDIFGSNMISVISTSGENGAVGGGGFSATISTLEPDTDYAYCAVVSNHATQPTEIKYGGVKTFRTNPCDLCPHTSVKTLLPPSIGPSSAILKGSYNSTRKIETFFEFKEKAGQSQVEAEQDLPTTSDPIDDQQGKIPTLKKIATSYIIGTPLGNFINAGYDFFIKNTTTNTTEAAEPATGWKLINPESHTNVRNNGTKLYTVTNLRKDIIYQYRMVAQTIESGPNANPVRRVEGSIIEFKTKLYSDGVNPLAHCFNKIKDQGETGVDVGGGCPTQAGSCYDNLKNGNETGIDTGGRCGKPLTCFNDVQDGNETGVDTGGSCGTPITPTCPPGSTGTPPNCTPSCPSGTTGTYPNCLPSETCPSGMTGTYPNCIFIQQCPSGYTGTHPNCVASGTCPTGTTGTPPNCIFVDPVCPTGSTGTYPNCNFSPCPSGSNCTCPSGFTGTLPNCIASGTCPTGTTGTYPNCTYNPVCPFGYSGTYPNCTASQTCPSGTTGTYPNCTFDRSCPFGFTGTLPNCTASGVCPTGTTGIYPNCKFDRSCPTGTTGTYPDCKFSVCTNAGSCVCPTNYTGTYPNCRPPLVCPSGMTGTFPDCIFDRECPTGYQGTFPSCIKSYNCPAGAPGVYPNCYSNGPLPAHCYNKVQDFDETGVDTGGSCGITINPQCPTGFTGNLPTCVGPTTCPTGATGTYPNCKLSACTNSSGCDCPTGTTGTYPNCKFVDPVCPTGFTGTYPICTKISTENPFSHCTNGVQDFGETSIDRGGGCGGVYPNNPTCFDNTQNGGETGVDTGGHCGNGPGFPSCFDDVKNGSETGVDTGGHCGNTNNGIDWVEFVLPQFTGSGTGSGTCANGVCNGNFIFNYPEYTGPFNGSWIAGNNNGNFTGNCTNGSCTGTFNGNIPNLNGPFNGNFTGGIGDGSNNPNYDWINMIFPGFSGTGVITGNCTNGICGGNWNGIMPGYIGPTVGIWSGPDGTGPFTGNCTATGCSGSWTGVVPGNNGPNHGVWTGGNGNGSNGNTNNQNWINIDFINIDGKGTYNGNCSSNGCSGDWTGYVVDHNGPINGNWTGPNGTGTFTGNCVDGYCNGTWAGGNSNTGPIFGGWDGTNKNNPASMIYNNTNGTGTFSGTCTTTTCSGNWTGTMPGQNGNINNTWTGPKGTGTFTGTCNSGVCTGTWTGGKGDVGTINGTWDGSNGNGNLPTTMVFQDANGIGTFDGTCTTTNCSGAWTGIIPGHTGPITDTWVGPNGTGNINGTCQNGVCTGTWNGGKGNTGPITGTWIGNNENPSTMIYNNTDGTGTFTGTCTTSTCSGNWTGIIPGATGNVSNTWAGPNGNGTFTGTCTTNNGCSGTWTGGKGSVGPINGTWDGSNGSGNSTTKMIFKGTDGTGTFTGTCTTTTCSGNWNGILPRTNGPITGNWTGPNGTGTFTGTCTNNVCNGTWSGGKGKVGPISGPWDGENKNNPANMKFDGTDGTGTFTGACTTTTCKGTWDGLILGHNGPISGKWSGPKGAGTFSGTCDNGVCTGTWTGGKGDEGLIYGTWNGTNGNGNDNELYLGYEGIPDVDDVVRQNEGVEHVFIRRIMINTELARKYGYTKDQNLLHFAWDLAHKFAKEFGYVDAEGKEIRVSLPDVSAYQLRQVGDKLTVYEYYQNKIIDIRDTTAVFKDKNSYEYYFQKN